MVVRSAPPRMRPALLFRSRRLLLYREAATQLLARERDRAADVFIPHVFRHNSMLNLILQKAGNTTVAVTRKNDEHKQPARALIELTVRNWITIITPHTSQTHKHTSHIHLSRGHSPPPIHPTRIRHHSLTRRHTVTSCNAATTRRAPRPQLRSCSSCSAAHVNRIKIPSDPTTREHIERESADKKKHEKKHDRGSHIKTTRSRRACTPLAVNGL